MFNWKILTLWFVCLMLVLAALIVKVSGSLSDPAIVPAELVRPASLSKPLSATPDFFRETAPDEDKPAPENKPAVVQPPEISARAYLVGNAETGQIYLRKNDSVAFPVASMSKLVTAVAAVDSIPKEALVEITPPSLDVPGEITDIRAGERFTVGELLYPLLLSSSNVSAEALASSSDRGAFLKLMPDYSQEAGMPSTLFADPSGLSSGNVSTASDFFNLARYLYRSRPDIIGISRLPAFDLVTTSEHGSHHFINIHPFVGASGFLGGKTGHTPIAKDTMLSIFDIRGIPVIFIVIGSDNRRNDTLLLKTRFQNMK